MIRRAFNTLAPLELPRALIDHVGRDGELAAQ
jgi:hypothetical protein